MGAYNLIVLKNVCPACGHTGLFYFQTHVASSFSGDESRRFCHREYNIGERMPWWNAGDPKAWFRTEKQPDWMEGADAVGNNMLWDCEEICYGECPACKVELCAAIAFKDVTPVRVLSFMCCKNP